MWIGLCVTLSAELFINLSINFYKLFARSRRRLRVKKQSITFLCRSLSRFNLGIHHHFLYHSNDIMCRPMFLYVRGNVVVFPIWDKLPVTSACTMSLGGGFTL